MWHLVPWPCHKCKNYPCSEFIYIRHIHNWIIIFRWSPRTIINLSHDLFLHIFHHFIKIISEYFFLKNHRRLDLYAILLDLLAQSPIFFVMGENLGCVELFPQNTGIFWLATVFSCTTTFFHLISRRSAFMLSLLNNGRIWALN